MIETLYRDSAPVKDKSECYVLVLTSRAGSGRQRFAFMEEHGKWDEDAARFRVQPLNIHADEKLTFEGAQELYKAARERLAAKGFVHSFVHQHGRKPQQGPGNRELDTAA